MRSAIKILCIVWLCAAALMLFGCVGNDDSPSLINTSAPIQTTPSPDVTTPTPAGVTTPTETTPAVTTPAQTTPADTTAPPEFDGWSDFH